MRTGPDVLMSRDLPDGRELTLYRMIFNLRLCIGNPDEQIYDDAWCFHREDLAVVALHDWDGEDSPYGWYKHVGSQTYQREFGA